uniref:NADH-ubiquinone oxidoreductase chain 2 n=1 Tax=Staphylinoidea sp. 15 KM-2017 TaxID=2219455 RepID=A0A346RIB4_9COLE|nr:NADH dehydrogenase subunit 2 [Staphylinoidea sp. 15 KM-2017]
MLFKMMFTILLMSSTMFVISSSSWFLMWIGLEINLLAIIPLLNSKKNLLSTESTMKYFITQALASTMILFTIISFFTNFSWLNYLMWTSLLTKLGMAPFHFWLPEIIEGLNWMNSLLILTWQKISPMIMISYSINFNYFFYSIIIISLLISGILGINQISLRKILTYSSINHMSWMISSMMISKNIWIYYFIIYTIISFNIIIMFKEIHVYYFQQLFLMLNNHLTLKIFFSLNLLSLSGIPPFLGFIAKWVIIENLLLNQFFLMTILMIFMTMVTMYFYMRILFTMFMINMNEMNYLPPKFNYNKIMLFNFMTIISFMFYSINFLNF